MSVAPELDDFTHVYDQGLPQVVSTTLVADLETPVSAMLKLADGLPNSFLLDSVEGGAVRGRYSIIGLKPDIIWRCNGNVAEINREARHDSDAFETCPQGALDALRSLVEESRIDNMPEDLPPMAAGVVGYMSYDMVRLMENLPDNNPTEIDVPEGLFIRPTIMAIFDSVKDLITVITPVRPTDGVSAKGAYNLARERLSDIVAQMERSLPYARESTGPDHAAPEPVSNTTKEEYIAMVNKAKEYIAAGDVFQVVPSMRFKVPFKLPPFSLYRALRRTNPAPFLVFLNFENFSIVGSSPEILVRLRDGKVTLRPLAGTRPRGATTEEDQALAADLLSDKKELAEHLMLLDLGRNDVGRVAKIGSVKVTEQTKVERYSHVMHIVSNVEGEIDPAHDAIDALIGGFPAGTVSGAPKVRAMEIIDELEKERRGVYAGAVGYFAANGSMDTCIVLRTAIVKDGSMYVQAGAGVVADSDPVSEYNECVNKAKALVRAAEEAIRFATHRGTGAG